MSGEYTTERGTVLGAEGPSLRVRLRRGPEGEGCGGCRACSLNALCKGRNGNTTEISVAAPADRAYTAGDEVAIGCQQANAALAAGIMFVPALAGLALGGWAGAGFGDAALIGGCALGFALGTGLSWMIARKADVLRPKAWVAGDAAEEA